MSLGSIVVLQLGHRGTAGGPLLRKYCWAPGLVRWGPPCLVSPAVSLSLYILYIYCTQAATAGLPRLLGAVGYG